VSLEQLAKLVALELGSAFSWVGGSVWESVYLLELAILLDNSNLDIDLHIVRSTFDSNWVILSISSLLVQVKPSDTPWSVSELEPVM
jgi:hypothetical protein